MLAAPREKTRYIVQPRGKPLYEDKNSFGLKMMAKMGWSKEKGLGANEDGQTEFITLRYKNNNSGMGFQEKDNQWTETEGRFDNLLKSLNDTGTTEDRTTESLEEKSKSSRARVHYKKFTRGKDTSRYTAKDLANIFGKKSLDEEADKAEEKTTGENENSDEMSHGVETIKSILSSYDYFKQKLGKFYAKKEGQQSDDTESKSDLEVTEQTGQEEEPPKKKKKKSAKLEEGKDELIEELSTYEPTKKKKKKRSNPVESPPEIVPEVQEEPKKKKKKNKLKSAEDGETTEILDNSITGSSSKTPEEVITIIDSPVSDKKKKKKSKKETAAEEEVIHLEPSLEEEPTAKKKSKKKKSDELLLNTNSLLEESPEEEPKKKKKKSKNEM